MADKLLFVDSSGTVKSVPAESAERAELAGWKPVSQEQANAIVADQKVRAENSTVGAKLKTFAESAATGAYDAATAIPRMYLEGAQTAQDLGLRALEAVGVSQAGAAREMASAQNEELNANLTGRQVLANIVGLSQELRGIQTTEAGARQAAEAQRIRAEVNPTTAFLGTASGQALAAVPLGLGGAARSAMAESFGSSAIARLGAAAATGATEGAQLGGIAAQDEAFLQNRRLTGEQILAAHGVGALLGGGLSFALEGGKEAFAAGREGLSSLVDRVTSGGEESAAAAGERQAGRASTVKAIIRGNDDDIKTVFQNTTGVAASPKLPELLRESVRDGASEAQQRMVSEAAEQMTQHAKQVVQSANDITEEVIRKPLKRSAVAANIAKSGVEEEALQSARDFSSGIRAQFDAASDGLPQSIQDVRVNNSGMRPASFDRVREQLANGESMRPIEIHQIPGEAPFLNDGRHRLAVAMERGENTINAQFRVYDEELNLQKIVERKIALNDAGLKELGGKHADLLGTKTGQSLLKQISAMDARVQSAKNAADAYMALDQVRRDAYSVLRTLNASIQRTTDVDARAALERAIPELNKTYLQAANFLADEATWGAQGTAQKEINSAWVRFIKAKDDGLSFFADKVAPDLNLESGHMVPKFEVNDGKVVSLIQRFGTPQGAVAERRFAEYLAAAKQLTEAIGKHVELPAEKQAALSALRSSTEGATQVFGEASENLSALNQVRMLQESAHMNQGAATLGAHVGGWIAGGPGSSIGSVLGALSNPAQLLQQRIALEQTAQRTRKAVSAALDGVFKPIVQAAQKGTAAVASGVSAAAMPAAVRRGTTALVAFQGKHDNIQNAYRSRVQELQDASAQFGGQVRDAATKSFGQLAQTDPHVVQAATVAATNGIGFLLSKAPTPLIDAQSMTPTTSKVPVSKLDAMTFATYWQTVMKPMTAVRDLARGTLLPEQVEALQAVYPSLYQWMRVETIRRIGDLDAKGIEIPIRQRQMLDLLLDLKGAGDPTLSPDYARRYGPLLGDGVKQQPKPPSPRAGPSHMASRLSTQTNSMIGGQSA